MYKAIIFDLDETLLDRTSSLRDFFCAQAQRLELSYSCGVEQAQERFLELDQRGRVLKVDVYRQLLKELLPNSPFSENVLAEDCERNFWRHAKAFDGFDRLFATISKLNAKTGLITNGRTHIQLRSLLALDLDLLVDAYLICQAEGLRKPDIAIFQRAANQLGVEAQDCLFVGDNPKADILGAQSAGMKAAWFDNGALPPAGTDFTPELVIHSLGDLQSHLNEVYQPA
ncbi:Pyrimidine 5'-nucleotidase YjjG [Pseudovibrio axinellae]|uniref:Pyrimidine 5'-nucleotidase YjjG n=1 Tax=Pseudovibrio axinellae TaxID=989403 RepID=A0A165YBV7_9HYPH|nr:HAD family hydrolase [Pseudovibrio axinellae]KZL18699.1 Pyrimidine 5'-nucleotidase YjjG [Pseudovibrio axinellae]SEP96366.1 putative hydrolase of the HAD superfamily [Pseudovibrio axinellae]